MSNFHPLKVVGDGSETQLQVGETRGKNIGRHIYTARYGIVFYLLVIEDDVGRHVYTV